MKLTLPRAAAALALAGAAIFAAPAAASAAEYPPVAPENITVAATAAGTFEPGETVNVLLSGEDANLARLGMVRAAYVANANIGSITATSSGSTPSFTIVLPATASGVYTYTLVGAGGGTPVTGTGSALPPTGLDSTSLLGLWVGGGALVLAGGAVAVAAAVRRQRVNADA